MKQWFLLRNSSRLCCAVFLLSIIGFSAEGDSRSVVSKTSADKVPLQPSSLEKANISAESHKAMRTIVSASDLPVHEGNDTADETELSASGQPSSANVEEITSESPGTAETVTDETRDSQTFGEIGSVEAPRAEAGDVTDPFPVVEEIEAEYVRSLTQITVGHNDSNPLWSPSGKLIAFERSIGDKREIIIANPDGDTVQKIYFRAKDGDEEMAFLFPGIMEEISYNSGITWSPDEKSLVFMSNAGSGNHDLYLWHCS